MADSRQILYYVMAVSAFSDKKGMSQKDAFNYLNDNGGIEFLVDCYEAEHTLSLDDAVNDLAIVCKNNGGTIE
jgi:hypothetical protein